MKKINKKALKVVEQVIRKEIDRDKAYGHPFCLGIFHQPKRPIESKK
ncbi:MAG: cyclic lactone autoinducer peptide [Eubacterium sp.]|nr:cyclic lactone autoinducer peptide [Eubacterium sp.]